MISKDPWPHIIIDDFLDKGLYKRVVEQILQSTAYNEHLSNHKSMYRTAFSTQSSEVVEESKLFDLLGSDIVFDLYEYCYPKCFQLLKELAPHKVTSVSQLNVQISICGKGFAWNKIHTDTADKLLTVVVYLHPKESIGTIVYTDPKECGTIQEWKQNRAMAFSREDNTWHDYKSGDHKRVTLMLHLK